MVRGLRLAAALLALGTGVALAQPPAPPTPSGSDEVVVTAIRPAQMRNFVRQLAEGGKKDQLSRWDRRVCPGVVGADPKVAQALIDRIVWRAFGVGLDGGRPGCRANALIVVTPDSAAFTPEFVDQNKRFFNYDDDNGNGLGKQALLEFANTPRPVRWWHVTQTVSDSGEILGDSVASMNSDGGFDNVQVARVGSPSRIRAGTREDFNRVIVIIDSRAVAGKPFDAVADYVAMITLAQIKADARRGGLETILSLFDAPASGVAPVAGWTDWDKSYLEGLYGANRFARTARQQENAIVRQVEKAARGDEKGTESGPPQR